MKSIIPLWLLLVLGLARSALAQNSFHGAWEGTLNDGTRFIGYVASNQRAFFGYVTNGGGFGYGMTSIASDGSFAGSLNGSNYSARIDVGGTLTVTVNPGGLTGSAPRSSFSRGGNVAGAFTGFLEDASSPSAAFVDFIIMPSRNVYAVVYYNSGSPLDAAVGTISYSSNTSANFNVRSAALGVNYSGPASYSDGGLFGYIQRPGERARYFFCHRSNADQRLINLSTRGNVGMNDNVLIGGIVIRDGAKRVMVRALGPSLSAAGVQGVLANPTLELRDSAGRLLAQNDDWRSSQATEIQSLGLAPSNNLESALIVNLEAGAYTAIVRGAGGATGVALVEAYEID